MTIRSAAVVLSLLAPLGAVADPAPCGEGWTPGFGWQSVTGGAAAITPVTHEGREMLLIAGEITGAVGVIGEGEVHHAVLWDGEVVRSPLPAGYDGARPAAVWAMVAAPEEMGGGVFAAGRFYADADASVAYSRIAHYDEGGWTIIAPVSALVHDLAIFDEGAGPRLFVGGEFLLINNESISYLARWDGAVWSPVGGGVNHRVRALQTHTDGQGPALFVGGDFSEAGFAPATRIARWSGASWSALGAGTAGSVFGLGSAPVDGQPALLVSGVFASAGGQPASRIAMWRAGAWSPMGAGFTGGVATDFAMFDRGDGVPVVHACGDFTASGGIAGLAAFADGQWSAAMNNTSKSMLAWDPPGPPEPRLVVTPKAVNTVASLFRLWDGANEIAISHGAAPHSFGGGRRLLLRGEGEDRRLLMFGDFSQVGGSFIGGLGAWNGTTWEAVPWWHGGRTYDMVEIDYNGAPALVVVGRDMRIDGDRVGAVVVYQNDQPFLPDGGLPGDNSGSGCVAVFPEGGEQWVVVGGSFDQGAGSPARRVAAWNGSEWRSLDANLSDDARIGSLAVYDSGEGPELYAGGYRLLGYSSVARWTGTEWAELEEYTAVSTTSALLSADVGEGKRLYIGGSFSQAFPGVQGRWSIISWDGETLRPFSTPLAPTPRPPFYIWYPGEVKTMEAHEVDGRMEMFVGGTFMQSGPRHLRRVARWSDGRWRALSRGVTAYSSEQDPVRSFAVWDDGNGTAAFLTGRFGGVGGVMSDFARFRLCTPSAATTLADLNADGVVDLRDVERLVGAVGDRRERAEARFDINGDGAVDAKDIEAALGAMGQEP